MYGISLSDQTIGEKGYEERVRLILVDTPNQKMSSETAVWPKRWPGYLVSTIWWAFVLSVAAALLSLMSLLAFSRYEDESLLRKPICLSRTPEVSSGVSSDTCRHPFEDGGNSVVDAMMESPKNAFFSTRFTLDWRSSCSLESMLKTSPGKNVFLVHYSQPAEMYGIFEKHLRSYYSNLIYLRADGQRFFEKSLFHGDWNNDSRSLRNARLLTVWQFGGTAMAEDVIVTADLEEHLGRGCLVSPYFIACLKPCSAFAYQLMLTARDNPSASMETLVDTSIKQYCGGRYICHGVNRLPTTCSDPNDDCLLFKIPDTQSPSKQIWNNLAHHCPITYSTHQLLQIKRS